MAIPLPEVQPTMPLWPDVGTILGLSRATTYAAAARGEIPTLRFGRRHVVATAQLRAMLGLTGAEEANRIAEVEGCAL